MASLHWICALMLALVCCLNARPTNITDLTKYIRHMTAEIDYLNAQNNNCMKDLELYSPTNVKTECLCSAMECVQSELNTLIAECNNTSEDFLDHLINLQSYSNPNIWNLSQVQNMSNSACQCEKYKQVEAEKFLNNTQDLVQQIYASKSQ